MKVLRLKSVSFMLVFVLMVGQLFAQQKTNPDSIRQKMQWFADAKLGIFIHWGIYAVADVSESWSFHNKQISWKDYMNQSKSFTAAKYDPADWASLIAASGARYSVITTKHHDGVALWDTKENNTLRIDLWTKDMMVDEMKKFYHQNIITLTDTYLRATGDEATTKKVKQFFSEIGKDIGVLQ